MKWIAIALLPALMAGCIIPRPQRGGTISHKSAIGSLSQTSQPENPKDSTSQKTESRSEKETIIAPGGTLEVSKVEPGRTNVTLTVFRVPQDAPAVIIREKLEDKSEVNVGGSFADTARELGAKLSAMRPVQWVGIACILGALVLAYFGWYTKAGLVGVVGISMIAIAAVIPGNEMWILGGGIAVIVVGSLLVLYAYHKGMLDKDNDGMIDLFQGGKSEQKTDK